MLRMDMRSDLCLIWLSSNIDRSSYRLKSAKRIAALRPKYISHIPNLALEATTPDPEGPSTQCFRTLVPKSIQGMVFGTRRIKSWVLGASGRYFTYQVLAATLGSLCLCGFPCLDVVRGSESKLERMITTAMHNAEGGHGASCICTCICICMLHVQCTFPCSCICICACTCTCIHILSYVYMYLYLYA